MVTGTTGLSGPYLAEAIKAVWTPGNSFPRAVDRIERITGQGRAIIEGDVGDEGLMRCVPKELLQEIRPDAFRPAGRRIWLESDYPSLF